MKHTLADIREAKAAAWTHLFSRAVHAHASANSRGSIASNRHSILNVVGLSIGYKHSGGSDLPFRCLKILVRKKVPKLDLSRSIRVLTKYDGIETDVEEVGYIRFSESPCLDPNSRQPRPFVCGVSISGAKLSTGSLGYVVRKKHTNKNYLLSNYHVFYPLKGEPEGKSVYQPGWRLDDNHADNTIGEIASGVKIRMCSENSERGNLMDAAIAMVPSDTVKQSICRFGKPKSGFDALRLNEKVWMYGGTSKGVSGIVEETDADTIINTASDCALFKHQCRIVSIGSHKTFGKGGDSGSVLVNTKGFACGLYFARDSQGRGYATPISRVLRHFDLVID